ncbi:MAG: hypothetical protein M0R21_07260 [Lentimicrobiaceae bacterium]|jgi:hypothetical protein|nr:hypothetical protein [Lentimicrobiaceae bacterium]
MDTQLENNPIFETLKSKANLKLDVYDVTLGIFKDFKTVVAQMAEEFSIQRTSEERYIPFEFKDKSEFEFEFRFAGDVLIFMMHTNIFEFSREHEVMRLPYIRDDKHRSYCGVIHIYNFLADSFKYNRMNDVGYLIGRVFINKEKHYFIEGKREIGSLYPNFATAVIENGSIRNLVEKAMLYTLNFDLLSPPYEQVKEVTLYEMQAVLDNMKIRTGKRLGFRFQSDKEETI